MTVNTKRITWRRILKNMSPFRNEHITLFDIVAKGDPDKEKKLVLLILRILHIPCIAIIPIAIIAIIIILSSRDSVPSTGSEITVVAALFYLMSVTMIFLGYKWPKTSKKFVKCVNKLSLIDLYLPPEYQNYMAVIMSHLFRVGLCFVTPILFGFFLGIISGNLYSSLPLFILATAALILTYPTNGKLAQWLSEQENTE